MPLQNTRSEHENSTDATDAVRKAIATFGSPHELLSDNGAAFNQLRNGVVGPLEAYLASVGCVSISGRPRNPQTQGKDERSHRTLFRFLEAHKRATLKQCGVLMPRAVSWYWVCVDVVLGGCALLVLAPASVRQGPGVG